MRERKSSSSAVSLVAAAVVEAAAVADETVTNPRTHGLYSNSVRELIPEHL